MASLPEEQLSDIYRAIPLKPSPNPRHEILATLEVSSKNLEKRCFGAAIGEAFLPNCNFEKDPEIRGFLIALEHGRSKIDLFLKYAPDLGENIHLDVKVLLHGYADCHRYKRVGPEAKSMLAIYDELAAIYQHQLPLGTSLDHTLANTRALNLRKGLGPAFEEAIGEFDRWKGPKRFKLDVAGSVLTGCGPEFRGATLSASMRIVVTDPTREAMMVASLQEDGWATSVLPAPQAPEKREL